MSERNTIWPCTLSRPAQRRIGFFEDAVAIDVEYDRSRRVWYASAVYPFRGAVEKHNGPVARDVDIGPSGVILPDGVVL